MHKHLLERMSTLIALLAVVLGLSYATTSNGKDGELETTEDMHVVGTAFSISADGYLITCEHVIRGHKHIYLTSKGKVLGSAQVVRTNPDSDIALLKVSGTRLTPIPLSADAPRLGDKVSALGFPLGNLLGAGIKQSDGIVSGIETIDGKESLLVDATINPGNSGGPLLNENREVIGVVNAKLSKISSSIDSYGFAIPVEAVGNLLDELSLRSPQGIESPDDYEQSIFAVAIPNPLGTLNLRFLEESGRERTDFHENVNAYLNQAIELEANSQIGSVIEKLQRTTDYAIRFGFEFNRELSFGNRAGGFKCEDLLSELSQQLGAEWKVDPSGLVIVLRAPLVPKSYEESKKEYALSWRRKASIRELENLFPSVDWVLLSELHAQISLGQDVFAGLVNILLDRTVFEKPSREVLDAEVAFCREIMTQHVALLDDLFEAERLLKFYLLATGAMPASISWDIYMSSFEDIYMTERIESELDRLYRSRLKWLESASATLHGSKTETIANPSSEFESASQYFREGYVGSFLKDENGGVSKNYIEEIDFAWAARIATPYSLGSDQMHSLSECLKKYGSLAKYEKPTLIVFFSGDLSEINRVVGVDASSKVVAELNSRLSCEDSPDSSNKPTSQSSSTFIVNEAISAIVLPWESIGSSDEIRLVLEDGKVGMIVLR